MFTKHTIIVAIQTYLAIWVSKHYSLQIPPILHVAAHIHYSYSWFEPISMFLKLPIMLLSSAPKSCLYYTEIMDRNLYYAQ